VVVLWPGGAPGALGTNDPDVPKLFCYPVHGAAEHAREEPRGERTAVIVLPGGGYRNLVMEKEGAAEARWLNEHGIEAFVLQYRLGPKYHFPAPMLDGARAVRYVRSHAAEMGVSPAKVGVWGFSAGGHLAGYLASVNDPGNLSSSDPIDRVSDRPDFAILSYARLSMDASIPRPTNLEALIGEHPTQAMINEISIDRRVNKATAPSLIFSTTADQQVNPMNATAYYDALKRASIPVELHIFERGPHGVGFGQHLKTLPELGVMANLIENWMVLHGWMEEDRKGSL
jgi:acetyl esterase/lipase